MDGVKNLMRRHTALVVVVLAMVGVVGVLGGEAGASPQCIAGGGAQVGTTCQITTAVTTVNPALCPYVLTLPAGEDLLITSTGSIKCDGPGAASATSISITVPGGQMEMQAGSEITAENTSGAGNGANITITVSGDMILRGPGVAGLPTDLNCAQVEGACISSTNSNGSGTTGNVKITVGNFPNTPPVGSFTMEPGSAVLANSLNGSAGAIEIIAGLAMDVDGLVRSFGGLTGTGGVQGPGGGPITLKSGCQLVITPDGVVSSEGRNPGADLVHLEGCEVTINGLVQSIALGNGGHALPNNPPNHCNLDTLTHPATNKYTACVEVWANNITINSILPNKGEVKADGVTDNSANDTRAWIDLFAKQNITINNDNVGPYSVHANSGTTEGDFGGLITIKAELGKFVSIGAAANSVSFAVQANATGQAGNGGDVIIEAGLNVELNGALVQALGGTASNRTGGSIFARSFNGFLLGNAPGALSANAAAPLVGAAVGVITLQGCGTGAAGDGVNYTGTTAPPATILADQCGGQPTVPAAFTAALQALALVCVQAPDCVTLCNKSGRKFNDLNGDGVQDPGDPGLPGWQICLFNSLGVLGPCQTTGVNGAYAFTNLACGEEFTFCEVLQDPWEQTFPTLPSADPRIVSCAALVGPGPGPLGPVGYKETLVQGVPSLNNDFGNFQDGDCPEDPDAVCTIKVGAGGLATVQAAYDSASDNDVICIFRSTAENGGTTENVVLGGSKSLTITQCTVAKVTAANNQLPVWTVSSSGKLTIIGPDASQGSIGWSVTSGGHDIKGVRTSGASQFGSQDHRRQQQRELQFRERERRRSPHRGRLQ